MDEELAYFEQLLRSRERECVEQRTLNASTTRPVSLEQAIGRVTRIDAIQQQQMALHGTRRLDLQADRIRAALQRLREGTYGECTMCGELIGRQRLEIVPEAPTCLECQRQLD